MNTRPLIANASALTFSHIAAGTVQTKPISVAAALRAFDTGARVETRLTEITLSVAAGWFTVAA